MTDKQKKWLKPSSHLAISTSPVAKHMSREKKHHLLEVSFLRCHVELATTPEGDLKDQRSQPKKILVKFPN